MASVDHSDLRRHAEECRRLAETVRDPFIRKELEALAEVCLAIASQLEQSGTRAP